MAKLTKTVARMLAKPAYTPVRDVERVLREFGYQEVNMKGSHKSFMNEAGEQVLIPYIKGKEVARTYIRELISILGLEEWYDENS